MTDKNKSKEYQKEYYKKNRDKIILKKTGRNSYQGAYPDVDDLTGIPDFVLPDIDEDKIKCPIWSSWKNIP